METSEFYYLYMKLLVDNYVKIYSEDMCVVDWNGGLYFEFVMPESIGRGCGLYSENRKFNQQVALKYLEENIKVKVF